MYRSRFTMRAAIVCLLVVGLYSTAVFVFATPPGSPYNPAETLNPSCAPGDANCYVALASGGVVPTNGLQTIGSDIGLGGTLTQNTFIDGDGVGAYDVAFGDTNPLENFFVSTNQDIEFHGQNFSTLALGTVTLSNTLDDISFRISDTNSGISSGVNLKTRDVVAGTATAGQVLTLIDAITGEMEWQNAGASATPTNGLQTIVSDIGLGGTLTQNTTVDLDSTYSMQFLDGDFSSVTNTTIGLAPAVATLGNFLSAASPLTIDSAEIGDGTRIGSLMTAASGTSQIKLFNGIGSYNQDFDGSAAQPMPLISVLNDDSAGSGNVQLSSISFPEGIFITDRHSSVGTLATPDLQSALRVRNDTFYMNGVNYTTDKSFDFFAETSSGFSFKYGSSTLLTEVFSILPSGDVGVGIDNFLGNTNGNVFQVGDRSTGIIGYVDDLTGNWVAVSDARKKHDIVDINYGLTQINALRPVSFKYNRNNEETIGFLAQQVLPIIPEVVFGSDAEGYGMSYQTLTPVLVKAIQELDVKIANIEALSVSTDSSRSSIISWFADAANGIQDFFAKRIVTENLCVSDASGNQTCVTKSQLDALLQLVPGSVPVTETIPDMSPAEEPVPDVVPSTPEMSSSETVIPATEPVPTETVPVSE